MNDNAQNRITKHLTGLSKLPRVLVVLIIASIVTGITTGYVLAQKSSGGGGETPKATTEEEKKSEVAQKDNRTFRDFAEGTIKAKKQSDDYSEGTHVLERTGQVPVTLTSSVVDLSEYENKKVKVFGETQKALKSGWLMDVGKVEVL